MLSTKKDNNLADHIAVVVIILMAIGTVFVFSAGANIGQQLKLQRFYDFPALRRLAFFPLAIIVLHIFSCFDYRRFGLSNGWLKSPVTYLLVLSIALLVLVLFPQFSQEINRARRWLKIPLGPVRISFQPSELAKWSVVFFLAAYCYKYRDDIKLYWKRFVPACLITGMVAGLIIIEDFGTAAFVSFLAFIMLATGGTKWWHLLTPAPLAAVAFCSALFFHPGRIQRIAAFLNPQKWADSTAYQANQSLIALGSGGLWGKGLGRGICKYGHLPEDTTDFIFAIIGEELGFVGTTLVIFLFAAFVWLGILVVVRCRDPFGQLLAGGIVLTIAIQAAINIGVVTVVLPTKGIGLPFVSAGGTGMLLSAAAVGVLLNIAKQSNKDTAAENQ
ncbi:MAG: cell division protein FtsW [Sedimentisphaerales bacterium]|nr:cell division protein FtsW [Sedimentisphaerales bacterium]